MMGWVYMVTCITDFIVFPVLWSAWQAMNNQPITQWDPLTLKGAGLFHMAMGAVLGVTAWSRGQEKMAGAQNGSANSVFTTTPNTGFSAGNSTLPTGSVDQSPTSGVTTSKIGSTSPEAKQVVPQAPMPPI
jgi:hypothetical protein